MKKEKIFALIFLGLIMVSFLAGVVSAQDTTGGPEIEIGKNIFSEWWNKVKTVFESPEQATGTVKALFWLLVTLFLIMFSMFAVKKPIYLILIIPISALVSYLLVAYITPEEAWGVLQSYTALGLALITIIPLAILIGMTYTAALTTSGFLRTIQFIGWISYLIYLGYRIALRLIEGKLHLILIITGIIALVAVIFNGVMYRKIRGQIAKDIGEESALTMREAALAAKSLKTFRTITGEK